MKKKTFIFLSLVLVVISTITLSCKKNGEPQSNDWLKGLKGKFVLSYYSTGTSNSIVLLNESGYKQILFQDYCVSCTHICKAKWVTDGSRILYYDGDHVSGNWYLMNSDGSNINKIETGYSMIDLTLSPDGAKYLFKDDFADTLKICVMKSDLSGIEHISNGSNPSWSPDGSKIYFTNHDGYAPSLFYIEIADRTIHKMVDLPANSLFWSWSPKKTKILFTIVYEQGYFTMDLDGSNKQRIGDFNEGNFLCWSPDDSKVVFTLYLRGLCVMNIDGSNIIDLDDIYPDLADWYE